MSQQTITCSHCGRRNRLPEGALVEARCRSCESALTYYTWIAPALRGGVVMRTVQYAVGAVLLALLLGPPLIDWLQTEPFRLNDRPAGEGPVSGLDDGIAGEGQAD